MKKLVIFALAAAVIIPGYSQDKQQPVQQTAAPEKKIEKSESAIIDTKAYNEIVLEDFEATQFTKKNIDFLVSRSQQGDLSIREEFPAQNGRSKKYLGVKFFGRKGATLKKTVVQERKEPAPSSGGGPGLNQALKSSLDRYRKFVQDDEEDINEKVRTAFPCC